MNLLLLAFFIQTATFESAPLGEVRKFSSEVGVISAAKGHAEFQQQHVASGVRALHIFGGDDRTVHLKLRQALSAQTEISFFAERWTRQAPFAFMIEGRSANKWIELYAGDSIKVGGFNPYTFIVDQPKIKELRITCTSAKGGGILLDDFSVSAPAPMEFVSSSTLQPVLPILVDNEVNPVTTLEIQARGNLKPIILKSIHVDLHGTSSLADIQQIDAVYAGEIVASIKEPKQLQFILPTHIELQRGKNQIHVSAQLKTSASLDGHVAVFIEGYQLSSMPQRSTPQQSAPRQIKRVGLALRDAGDGGANSYRIPGLATTPQGTLIAVYDIRWKKGGDLPGDIDVGMSRSIDGGHHWEEMKTIMDMGDASEWNHDGIGDPSVLVDQQNGDILVFALWSHGNRGWHGSAAGMSPEETGQLMMTRSTDDGKTWSAPSNVTAQLKQPSWRLMLQGPGRGITMRDGTLVLPMQYRDSVEQGSLPSSFLAISSDHGKTWHASAAPKSNTTEAQVVELSEGRLMLNMRDNRGGSRSIYVTDDLGKTWQQHATSRSALREPVCMASIINIPGRPQVLLFSNPDVSSAPRRNMTLKASLDEGASWPLENQLLIDQGQSAGYSCMTMIDANTIGILFEGSLSHLTFMRIPLKELHISAD
ncbi:MAG: sialidase-1 [Myxococcota bacterium]